MAWILYTVSCKCPCVSTTPRPSRPTHIHWQRGIPVVTVAIDNGTNAGLQFGSSELVFRTWDVKWRRKYYCRKGRKLELVGWESYQVKRT